MYSLAAPQFLVLALAAASSVSAVLLAGAGNVHTVPITRPATKTRSGAFRKGLPEADRARAQHFLAWDASSSVPHIPITNFEYSEYLMTIGVGSPPTSYSVSIDTGSSNTFVGAGKPYIRTNTSVRTGQKVYVDYDSGFYKGLQYWDDVTIAPGITIKNQSISDSLKSATFEGTDGLIGVGPRGLTLGTLTPGNNTTIATPMDNAYKQGLIAEEVLGISFVPANNDNDTNGALSFGGPDPEYYVGDITYVPVTKTRPSAYYWGINVTSASLGSKAILPESVAGIVDTGTTLLLVGDNYYKTYLDSIPGAKYDNVTGLTKFSEPSSLATLPSFDFKIGGKTFSFDAAAQVIPQDQNKAWGGSADARYGVVGPTGSFGDGGLDFILGMVFMERYYAVFDTTRHRVGFAETKYTNSKTGP